MEKIFIYIEIIISIALTISILLQNRGSGLSAAFGGDFSGFYTKRGLEKFLYIISIVLGSCFIINAFLILLIQAK